MLNQNIESTTKNTDTPTVERGVFEVMNIDDLKEVSPVPTVQFSEPTVVDTAIRETYDNNQIGQVDLIFGENNNISTPNNVPLKSAMESNQISSNETEGFTVSYDNGTEIIPLKPVTSKEAVNKDLFTLDEEDRNILENVGFVAFVENPSTLENAPVFNVKEETAIPEASTDTPSLAQAIDDNTTFFNDYSSDIDNFLIEEVPNYVEFNDLEPAVVAESVSFTNNTFQAIDSVIAEDAFTQNTLENNRNILENNQIFQEASYIMEPQDIANYPDNQELSAKPLKTFTEELELAVEKIEQRYQEEEQYKVNKEAIHEARIFASLYVEKGNSSDISTQTISNDNNKQISDIIPIVEASYNNDENLFIIDNKYSNVDFYFDITNDLSKDAEFYL